MDQKEELLTLLQDHAYKVHEWSLTSCDPTTIAKQKNALHERAKRVLELVEQYLAPTDIWALIKSNLPVRKRRKTARKRRRAK